MGFFNIPFAILFICGVAVVIFGGALCIGYVCSKIITFIVDGFKMGKLLKNMAPLLPTDAETRDYVIQMRTRNDAARMARLKKKRDEALRALQVDLPNGLPAHMKYLEKDATGEVDVTQEILDREARYLVCTDPLGETPKFFHSILPGRATEKGARDVRFNFTAVRSMGRKMTKAECAALLPHLPKGGRDLYIVSDESGAAKVNIDALVHRVMDRLTQEGVTLEEMNAALAQRAEERS